MVGQRSANCLTRDRFDRTEPMTAFSSHTPGVPDFERLSRKPQRVTVTLPWMLRDALRRRAAEEGRSLSNLIAYLLERANPY